MPSFSYAPEVRDIAADLIRDDANHLGSLRPFPMIYLFTHENKGAKAIEWGKAQKLSGLLSVALQGRIPAETFAPVNPQEYEGFLILLNFDLWEKLTGPNAETEKQQIVYHHLLRCHVDEEEKLEVRQPDMFMFTEEVHKYGCSLPSVKAVLDALEPQAALDFEEGLESVTLTVGDQSVTLPGGAKEGDDWTDERNGRSRK